MEEGRMHAGLDVGCEREEAIANVSEGEEKKETEDEPRTEEGPPSPLPCLASLCGREKNAHDDDEGEQDNNDGGVKCGGGRVRGGGPAENAVAPAVEAAPDEEKRGGGTSEGPAFTPSNGGAVVVVCRSVTRLVRWTSFGAGCGGLPP